MRTVAELIKIGLEDYFVNGQEPYMCYILSDLAEEGQITSREYRSFKEWLLGAHGIHSWESVSSHLCENLLEGTDGNWENFYVWAYYDLVKGGE